MSFAIAITSYSQTNPFQKNKDRITAKTASMKNHGLNKLPILLVNSGNANVAQLLKQSWWDDQAGNWLNESANRRYYVNDRLVKVIQMSYDQTDTFNSYEYTYDASGRYILVEYKMFNQVTHQFENYSRYTITYSTNSSSVTLGENYNPSTSTWENNSRTTQIFDSRANLVRYKLEYYDSGLWVISYINASYISYYGNTKKKAIELDSVYIDTSSIMLPNYKTEKVYDANGKVAKINISTYNNGIEELEEVDSIHYDSNGVPTELIAYTPALSPIAKLSNLDWAGKFNPDVDLYDNEPVGYNIYEASGSNWDLVTRYSTSFPDNNGSSIRLKESYINNVFIPDSRSTRMFDAHKNRTEESEEVYYSVPNIWEIQYASKNYFQYDANDNITEIIYTSYDFADSAFINNSKEEYSEYITIAAGVNTSRNTIETKLYPNPSNSGKVYIDLNLVKSSSISIEIIDINGRIVNVQHQDLGQGLNTVELNGLNKGMYFVMITSEEGVSRTKLLVK